MPIPAPTIEQVAAAIVTKLTAAGGELPRRELTQRLSSAQRKGMRAALLRLIGNGRVERTGTTYRIKADGFSLIPDFTEGI